MDTVALGLHIAAGTVAMVAATVAIGSKTANLTHRAHVLSGQMYVGAIAVVVVTALALAVLRPAPVMLLIALFSGYFVWAGWRLARNRGGTPTTGDRAAAWLMAAVSVVMAGWCLLAIGRGEPSGIIVVVFGVIGLVAVREDLGRLRAGGVRGRERISAHLGRMLGATIATLTAVLVVNVDVEPQVLVWLTPTIVLTPVIVWWERRLRAGVRPRGMPAAEPSDSASRGHRGRSASRP